MASLPRRSLPRTKAFDGSFAFLLDPYGFISKRCQQLKTNMFQTRLQLEKTICMRGAEAAALFYDESRFIRKKAMPAPVKKTLLGEGGVQTLDGAAHKHRKRMFMALMTPTEVTHLTEITAALWRTEVQRWTTLPRVVLYDEIREILTRAVCEWGGVPLPESDVSLRTSELSALFSDPGTVRHFWSRTARKRAEAWTADLIERIRSGEIQVPEGRAAHTIAFFRDHDGALFSPRTAAVELLNVLRPVVAVSVFITFAAHALHSYPETRPGNDAAVERFVQEVRRYYPFFPAVPARVRQDFQHNGYDFRQGTRVMLDLYGTNHDPLTWGDPENFRPARFLEWDESAQSLYSFIPQGGGNPFITHRCPGEGITVALMKAAVVFLARDLRYEMPPQNTKIQRRRLPALPHSRIVLSNIRVNAPDYARLSQ
jgi:fatty-acid peroxygenase